MSDDAAHMDLEMIGVWYNAGRLIDCSHTMVISPARKVAQQYSKYDTNEQAMAQHIDGTQRAHQNTWR